MMAMDDHDLFISHASEDKDEVARPLAAALKARGWRVWLDELVLTVGDSLNGRIEAALAHSRFGVVVLSPTFFSKSWPVRELAGLAAREAATGDKVILPVWHNVDYAYLVNKAPMLADRLGALTDGGIENVADELARALEAAFLSPTAASGAPIIQSVADAEPRRDTAPAAVSSPTVEPPLWTLLEGPTPIRPVADHYRVELIFVRNGERRPVYVDVSGTAAASELSTLSPTIAEAIRTAGRSLSPSLLRRGEPPQRILVSTKNIAFVPREGAYESGDRVVVREGERWIDAEFVRPGAPDEATTVFNSLVEGESLARDQALVRLDSGKHKFYAYEDIRAEVPRR
jgi:TIR domain-containing protein